MQAEAIREALKDKLTKTRYLHSIGVQEVARDLAVIHGCDETKAELAGILHDCAKYLSDDELLQECVRNKLALTEFEQRFPFLIHAKVGALFARTQYGLEDEEVLDAIRYHTTGRPAMSTLEMIIYLADYIEPNRKPLPRITQIRTAAYENLELAVYLTTENVLNYLRSRGQAIDTLTEETFNYYKGRIISE